MPVSRTGIGDGNAIMVGRPARNTPLPVNSAVRLPEQFTFCWTPALELRLRELLKKHRRAPRQDDTSPEMLDLAVQYEKRLENETLKWLLKALSDNPPPTLDCDLLGAMDRLKATVFDFNAKLCNPPTNDTTEGTKQ